MMIATVLASLVAAQSPSAATAPAPLPLPRLADPVVLTSAGEPITVDVGHAAPCVHDFDGDGKQDLVLGQFGDGKARVYRNVGGHSAPAFDGFEWLEASGEVAKVQPG